MVFLITIGAVVGISASGIAALMGVNAYRDYKAILDYKPLFKWDVDEVSQFISSLGSSEKWMRKYPMIVWKSRIDGEYLTECDKYDLIEVGFERKDARRLLRAFTLRQTRSTKYTKKKPKRSKKKKTRTRN